MIIIQEMNINTSNNNPTTLIELSTGDGHLLQTLSEVFSYLTPFSICHSFHSIPVYPVLHSVGPYSLSMNPPFQASGLIHLIIVEELIVFFSRIQSRDRVDFLLHKLR